MRIVRLRYVVSGISWDYYAGTSTHFSIQFNGKTMAELCVLSKRREPNTIAHLTEEEYT